MSRGGLPALAGLEIGDPPESWERLGFGVGADDTTVVGGVALRLAGRGGGEGLRGWSLRAERPPPEAIDGIPTRTAAATADDGPAHRNGAVRLDHVVVRTPALARTLAALEATGMEVRRVRDAGTPEQPLSQAFLWAGDLEEHVAGPPEGESPEPAGLWGLVVVVPELEALHALGDGVVGEIRDAVQPGRRIATVPREAGLSVPLAFMTPHPRAAR